MSGIQTSVQVMDRITQPMMSMVRAMNMVINSFDALDNASSRAIDVDSLATARAEMANAGAQLKQINDSLVKAQDKTDKIKENVTKTEETAEKLDTAYRKANSEIDKAERNTESAKNHQRAWSSEIARSTSHSSALLSNLKSIIITLGGTMAGKAMFSTSDSMAQATARLNLMNDGFQTTYDLQEKIFNSSQRARADYQDTIAVVSRLGLMAKESFKSNDEMIRFSELMNMQFKIGGSSTTEQQSAMYQLSQAMASGRLQGDEYRSIIENAPLLARSIEDYMTNVVKAKGTMKDWASDGLLTADVIKTAMFRAADETEARFEKIPLTYADVWTTFKNDLIQNIQPSLTRLNDIANTDRFEKFKESAIDALTSLAETAVDVFDDLIDAANYLHDNWDDIAPQIYGIVAAYAAWEIGTKMLATANMFLNSTNPVGWISTIAGIATTLGLGVTAYNQLTRETKALAETNNEMEDTLGVTSQSAYIAAEKVRSLMDQYNDLEAKVEKSKEDHDKMNTIILQLENTIPGLSNQIRTETGFIDDLTVSLRNATDQFYNLATAKAYYNAYSSKLDNAVSNQISLQDQYDALMEKNGKGLDNYSYGDYLKDMSVTRYNESFNPDTGELTVNKTEDEYKGAQERIRLYDQKTAIELKLKWADESIDSIVEKMSQYQTRSDDYGKLYGDPNIPLGEIAANTNTIADALTEDIQYLRDAAEREAINRYTTVPLSINIDGIHNTVTNNQDLDGMVDYITDKLGEELNNTAQAHNRS